MTILMKNRKKKTKVINSVNDGKGKSSKKISSIHSFLQKKEDDDKKMQAT